TGAPPTRPARHRRCRTGPCSSPRRRSAPVESLLHASFGSLYDRAMADVADGVLRTSDDAFADLPEFPFAPHYRDVEGLRLAHIDEGDGALVLFMHGEPTWSFLWRRLI